MAAGQRMRFTVDGMSCSHCERKIETALGRLAGVQKVWASAPLSEVIVHFDPQQAGAEAMREAIREAGYTVRGEALSGVRGVRRRGAPRSRTGGDGADAGGRAEGAGRAGMSLPKFFGLILALVALYLIVRATVGFNFLPAVNQSMGYGLIFVVGLLTSLHCIAMCGGITLSQTLRRGEEGAADSGAADGAGESADRFAAGAADGAGGSCHPQAAPSGPSAAGGAADGARRGGPPWSSRPLSGRFLPAFLYNSGRVVSYTVLGGIVGALGSVFSLSTTLKGAMPAVAGVFMLFIGLKTLGIFPWLSRLRLRLPGMSGGGKLAAAAARRGPLFVGLLNGLMPCGPLQTMQVYALGTGSFLAGAFSMFLFSLGTVPLLFGFGAVSTLLSARFNRGMLRVSGVLVIVLGVVMFTRGMSLFGVAMPGVSLGGGSVAVAALEDGRQVVTTPLDSGRYYPFIVQKGVPVRWIITAEPEDLNGCNNPITVPRYGIRKELFPGENVIEFTPDETGTITYTCWMGMISSSIRVVPDLTRLTAADLKPGQPSGGRGDLSSAFPDGGGGGCCPAAPGRFAGGRIPTDQIAMARLEGGGQIAEVRVDADGYSPAVVVLQRGVKAKIRFAAGELNSCNYLVEFPAYNGRLDLSQGRLETPYIEVLDDFIFRCSMGMINGYVKVVDDLASADLNAIRKEVDAFRASGGGCCGN